MKKPIQRIVALAVTLALTACGGGGGSGSSMLSDGDGSGSPIPPGGGGSGSPMSPNGEPPGEPLLSAVPFVSGLYFDYRLARSGETPLTETGAVTLSCPGGGDCATTDLRLLSDDPGADVRDGFGTLSGSSPSPSVTEIISGAAVTSGAAAFTRYGFWAEHGYAAVEVGMGDLSALFDGQQWSGSFMTTHAWAAGETTGTNPVGTGSATWEGIAEAARTDTFDRLFGTAEVRIGNLSQPLVNVDIDLGGGVNPPLMWTGMELTGGSFSSGTAGSNLLSGRFYGPVHEEAWGVFDTGDLVGAFGARRQ